MLEFLLGISWLYLVPFLPIASAIWFFGRKRVQWNLWDFTIVLLPSAIWAGLITIAENDKSLANIMEIFCLGCAAAIAPIVRVVVGKKGNQKTLAFALLLVICFVAIGLWAFVPGLPE